MILISRKDAEMLTGVNPARAGMIPRRRNNSLMMQGKPRASGDDPAECGYQYGTDM